MSHRGISPLMVNGASTGNGPNGGVGSGAAGGGVNGGGGGGGGAYLRQQQHQQHQQQQDLPSPEESANTTTVMMMTSAQCHNVLAAIQPGRVAVITGASCGIGRAAAREFVRLGMKVALADISADKLQALGRELAEVGGKGGDANVLVIPTDVSKLDQVVKLRDRVYEVWGEVAVLMNNAGIADGGYSWHGIENWKKVFDANLFGILNVQQTFVPSMIHQENEAVIVNTGSREGITNPPGNPAYNASKAAVKSLTESLAYELRELSVPHVTAHLFIPGWTNTGLAGKYASPSTEEKPAGAWTAEQTVSYMLDRLREGDFYILCPDDETSREVDRLRILWSAQDITEGRPALSRWHPYHATAFEEYMREGLTQAEQV